MLDDGCVVTGTFSGAALVEEDHSSVQGVATVSPVLIAGLDPVVYCECVVGDRENERTNYSLFSLEQSCLYFF